MQYLNGVYFLQHKFQYRIYIRVFCLWIQTKGTPPMFLVCIVRHFKLRKHAKFWCLLFLISLCLCLIHICWVYLFRTQGVPMQLYHFYLLGRIEISETSWAPSHMYLYKNRRCCVMPMRELSTKVQMTWAQNQDYVVKWLS